ncbi:hypothetical protein HDV00_010626, partial [Rhizophlyctis rosea]
KLSCPVHDPEGRITGAINAISRPIPLERIANYWRTAESGFSVQIAAVVNSTHFVTMRFNSTSPIRYEQITSNRLDALVTTPPVHTTPFHRNIPTDFGYFSHVRKPMPERLMVSVPFARTIVQPLRTLEEHAQRFRRTKFKKRIPLYKFRLSNVYTDLNEKVRERTEALELACVQAEAASKVKSSFVAMISHELRTPMNGEDDAETPNFLTDEWVGS